MKTGIAIAVLFLLNAALSGIEFKSVRIDESREKFLKQWPLKYKKKEWTTARLRLEPDQIKPPGRPPVVKDVKGKKRKVFTKADYAQHILKLKRKYQDSKKMTFVVEPPFVVVGDETEENVRTRSKGTVRWATKLLKKDFFKHDPDRILTIWLLGSKKSYHAVCRMITGVDPDTPYGFYSSRFDALIMNIATGGGTLVHEIVHPFMAANFPDCPAWLNEGMGSLYEQCGYRNNRITGFTNWRLANLQRLLKKDALPDFKTLLNYSDDEFYAKRSGDNYAQSRYLCYYLQEKGLLRKFFHAFLANRKNDPSGYRTLKKILKQKDMKAFMKEWKKFVLGLTYP